MVDPRGDHAAGVLAAGHCPCTHERREEIERAAVEDGMRTLWDDGLVKVAARLTSIEELARVTV